MPTEPFGSPFTNGAHAGGVTELDAAQVAIPGARRYDSGDRFVAVEGLRNLRDIGGYPVDGGTTRWGLLFRSGALGELTPAAREQMAALGLRTIVDLREEDEVTDLPSMALPEGIAGHRNPVFRDRFALPELRDLEQMYGQILDVPEEVVAEDYGRTAETLTGEYRDRIMAKAIVLGLNPERARALMGSSPETMQAILAAVRDQYRQCRRVPARARLFAAGVVEPAGAARGRRRRARRMTLTRATACVGAVALSAGLVVVSAGAASAARTTYVQVTEVRTGYSDTFENGPPKAGATFSFTSNLTQKGKQVGTDAGVCLVKKVAGPARNPTAATTRCTFTLDFTSGTIKLAGKVVFDFAAGAADFVLPIVKSAGRFEGVTGAMKHHSVSATEAQLTLLLTRPGPAGEGPSAG